MRFGCVLVAMCMMGIAQQASTTTTAAVDPALDTDIRKLFDLLGLRQALSQVREQAIKNGIQAAREQSKYSPEFLNEFEKRFRQGLNLDAYVDVAVRVYAQHFTDDEVKQIIAFQTSPVGRKLVSETPAVQKEITLGSMRVGADLGYDIGAEIGKEHPEYLVVPTQPAKK